MAKKKKEPLMFKYGDRVKIRLSGGVRGRIVEEHGPLGPGGALLYRVRVPRKPKAIVIDVRADQLELLPEVEDAPNGESRS